MKRLNEEEIFAAALLKAPAARGEFLDRACQGDTLLRAGVEALLAAHDVPDSFLDAPLGAASGAEVTLDRPTLETPGATIGPYKLLQQIGEGGFGIVFMAEQTEPLRRRVALKVIKPGMDTRQVIARFEAERQALALMDHPNIAKVLDAGEVASASGWWLAGEPKPSPALATSTSNSAGRPYFVMELVRGTPITQYCDENQQSVRQRLALFAGVCQAIQHAHTKGIIHRDIKPTNVLVASQDGQPLVKVIDFGVAKALGQQLTDKTLFTEFAQMIGTPLYMSPEQAEMSSIDIDTRSDVYSLGVLLYELLTGSTPVTKEQLKQAAFDEIRRIIREDEPPKPSTRLSTAVAAPSIAAQRHTEPAKLTRLVRGELDWIVMKALDKDRNRRYETASNFAADVSRYLADEPVQACPPSAWYRFRKFARRHKGPVFAASLILLALVCGVIGTTWGLIRAEQQRLIVERQRDEFAERNERTRKAIETVTSEAAIDQLTRESELRPEQKDFLDKMVEYYAESAQDVAATEQERSRQAQAYFRIGRMNQTLGRSQDSENAYRRAVALGRQLVADFPGRPELRKRLAGSLGNLATVLHRSNHVSEAETTNVEAAAIYRKLAAEFKDQSDFRQALAGILHNLGNVFCVTNRLSEAETAFGESLAIRKQLAVELPDRPILRRAQAMSHNSLGWLYQLSNRLPEAEAAYAESLALYKQLDFDADFPNRPEFRMELATSQCNLGNVLALTNRPKEAEAAHAAALSVFRQLVAEYPNRPEFRKELADAEAAQAHAAHK